MTLWPYRKQRRKEWHSKLHWVSSMKCNFQNTQQSYLQAFLSRASFGSLLTLRAVGVNLVTSPNTFLIWGLADIVAVSFFSSAAFCGSFMILGGAERTLGFCCGGATPGGGGSPGGIIPGGPPGGLIILGGGIPEIKCIQARQLK